MVAIPARYWAELLAGIADRCALEAVAIELDTGIGDPYKPDCFVAGTDIRNIDAERFQTAFERFDGEIILV